MNRDNPKDCQRIVDNKNDPVSVGIVEAGGISNSLSGADRAIMEELDSIFAEFVATSATPVDTIEQLPPEYAAALADFEIDDPHEVDTTESAAIRAARAKLASPEAKALLTANKAHGHTAQAMDAIDAHRRTPEGRRRYNAKRKKERDEKIWEQEGRVARTNRHHATEEDRKRARRQDKAAEQKARRDAMTPDQKKEENEKRSARRRAAKEAAITAREAAIKSDPDFGSF